MAEVRWKTRIPPVEPRRIQSSPRTSSTALPSRERYNPVSAPFRQVRGALMGLYQRHASRFWWRTYTGNEERNFECTKSTTNQHTKQIWNPSHTALHTDPHNTC